MRSPCVTSMVAGSKPNWKASTRISRASGSGVSEGCSPSVVSCAHAVMRSNAVASSAASLVSIFMSFHLHNETRDYKASVVLCLCEQGVAARLAEKCFCQHIRPEKAAASSDWRSVEMHRLAQVLFHGKKMHPRSEVGFHVPEGCVILLEAEAQLCGDPGVEMPCGERHRVRRRCFRSDDGDRSCHGIALQWIGTHVFPLGHVRRRITRDGLSLHSQRKHTARLPVRRREIDGDKVASCARKRDSHSIAAALAHLSRDNTGILWMHMAEDVEVLGDDCRMENPLMPRDEQRSPPLPVLHGDGQCGLLACQRLLGNCLPRDGDIRVFCAGMLLKMRPLLRLAACQEEQQSEDNPHALHVRPRQNARF